MPQQPQQPPQLPPPLQQQQPPQQQPAAPGMEIETLKQRELALYRQILTLDEAQVEALPAEAREQYAPRHTSAICYSAICDLSKVCVCRRYLMARARYQAELHSSRVRQPSPALPSAQHAVQRPMMPHHAPAPTHMHRGPPHRGPPQHRGPQHRGPQHPPPALAAGRGRGRGAVAPSWMTRR